MRTNNLISWLIVALIVVPVLAQTKSKKDMTPEEISQATLGTSEQQHKAFPPHKIIGNVYFVGTEILGSFLVATPDGLILINSSFEANVPIIRASVEKLGFKFTDIKILLGSHAHADHQEGDALVKQLTGAQVMSMTEDVPALRRMRPGGKDHPIDHPLVDGETVSLGGTTLTAHLTPGHTSGNTTWTMKAQEDGKSYDVVIMGGQGVAAGQSLFNANGLTAAGEEFTRSFKFLRSIHCDVGLGSHNSMYNLMEKYPRMGKGPNPYIDPAGWAGFAQFDVPNCPSWPGPVRRSREATSTAQTGW